jgi:hypothetical protein
MAQIFISYRRTDAGGHAGRLHTLLRSHYSDDDIFFDVAGIGDGRDWEFEIKKHLEECEVLLVVIGPDWLSAHDPDSFQRRIDQPGDWVRLEVETGLKLNKVVIPVLVNGVQLPAKKDHLPATIQELLSKEAREIPHKNAESAVRLLVEQLRQRFPEASPASKAELPPNDTPDRLQQKRFSAVERLWEAVLDLKKGFQPTLFFYGILLPAEYDSMIGGNSALSAALNAATEQSISDAASRVEDVESLRPYLGDELWVLFFTYRSFLMRLTYLLIVGKREAHILDWHGDQPLLEMLRRVIPSKTLEGILLPKDDASAVYRVESLLQSLILAKVQLITAGKPLVHVQQSGETRTGTEELKRELESLVENFVNASNPQLLQRAWNVWAAWLESNRLQYLPGNQKILGAWATYSDKFHAASSDHNVALWSQRLALQVKDTQLTHQ